MLSDCIFQTKGFSLHNSSIVYRSIVVDYVSFASSFYLINETNNYFSTSLGNVTLINGNYDVDDLITMITTLLPDIDASYDNNSGNMTFLAYGPFYIYASTTCYTLIGGVTGSTYFGEGTITMPNPVNLLGTRSLAFRCDTLAIANWIGDSQSPVLITIPINSFPFNNILYQNLNLQGQSPLPDYFDLNEFHIQVFDQNNNLVDFNNVSWIMSISVTSYRVIDFSPRVKFNDLLTIEENNDEGDNTKAATQQQNDTT